jgi:hypothetical protein
MRPRKSALIPHVVELINIREKIASQVVRYTSPELAQDLAKINEQIEQFVGDSAQYAAMVWAAMPAAS